ncbi:ATP synthase F0 subcomplex subunit OSCP atp5 [Polyrhizophydium stewartii]|uniref:ATP synthase subunit 5, mitochondrial n=1 Tax=Polyrhizophydium stewartii TaxID=2732419 RepID=A0ABR4MYS3_9FUNG
MLALRAVPLALHGIDGRYATALFTAASKQNVLDKVEAELKSVEALIARDAGVQTFLNAPLLNRTAKKEGVKSLLAKGTYSPVTKNFFDLLAENGRLDQTEKILVSFAQLMSAARGQVAVTVTSAKALDVKALNKLKDTLSKSTLVSAGSQLVVANNVSAAAFNHRVSDLVDPEIIGGLVIEIGDKTIDLSVSSKVTKLNNLLSQAV